MSDTTVCAACGAKYVEGGIDHSPLCQLPLTPAPTTGEERGSMASNLRHNLDLLVEARRERDDLRAQLAAEVAKREAVIDALGIREDIDAGRDVVDAAAAIKRSRNDYADRTLKAEIERDELRDEEERSAEYLRRILSEIDKDNNGMAVCSWCALPTLSDEASKRAHQETCSENPMRRERDSARAAAAKMRGVLEMAASVVNDEEWRARGCPSHLTIASAASVALKTDAGREMLDEMERLRHERDDALTTLARRNKDLDETGCDLDDVSDRANALWWGWFATAWGEIAAWVETEQAVYALEFYADPSTYFAIGIFPDSPCGEFIDDFSETHLGLKPGKRAREFFAALAEIDGAKEGE